MTVGFIGLGTMGKGMVTNLLAKGFRVTVWNRTAGRLEPMLALGAASASSPSELASRSKVVLICVSDTPDVREMVEALVPGMAAGTVLVDHSTISPAASVELAERVERAGGHFLDAPVSGGAEGAAKGTLSIMVGGDSQVLAGVIPVLEAYATSITHVGPTGSGQLVKLANQILVVVNQMAASEALLFARAAGLDLTTTLEAVKGGAGGSWMLTNRGPQMIEGDWRPGFTVDLQTKDLRLVLDQADRLGVPLPATGLVFQLYRSLQTRGLGQEGNHALVKALEQLAGIKLVG